MGKKYHYIGFQEKRQFFAYNWQKSSKNWRRSSEIGKNRQKIGENRQKLAKIAKNIYQP
jgi:hypothetical protein